MEVTREKFRIQERRVTREHHRKVICDECKDEIFESTRKLHSSLNHKNKNVSYTPMFGPPAEVKAYQPKTRVRRKTVKDCMYAPPLIQQNEITEEVRKCADCGKRPKRKLERIIIQDTTKHKWLTKEAFQQVYTFNAQTKFCDTCKKRELNYYQNIYEEHWKSNNNYLFLKCPTLKNASGQPRNTGKTRPWTDLLNKAKEQNIILNAQGAFALNVQTNENNDEEDNYISGLRRTNKTKRDVLESDSESVTGHVEKRRISIDVNAPSSSRMSSIEQQELYEELANLHEEATSSNDGSNCDIFEFQSDSESYEESDYDDLPEIENPAISREHYDMLNEVFGSKQYAERVEEERNLIYAAVIENRNIRKEDEDKRTHEEEAERRKREAEGTLKKKKTIPKRIYENRSDFVASLEEGTGKWIYMQLVAASSDNVEYIKRVNWILDEIKTHASTSWIAAKYIEAVNYLYENIPGKKICEPVQIVNKIKALAEDYSHLRAKQNSQLARYKDIEYQLNVLPEHQIRDLPTIKYFISNEVKELINKLAFKSEINDLEAFLNTYSMDIRESKKRTEMNGEESSLATQKITVQDIVRLLGISAHDFATQLCSEKVNGCEDVYVPPFQHITEAQKSSILIQAGNIISTDLHFRTTVRPIIYENAVVCLSSIFPRPDLIEPGHPSFLLSHSDKDIMHLSELTEEQLMILSMEKRPFVMIEESKVEERIAQFGGFNTDDSGVRFAAVLKTAIKKLATQCVYEIEERLQQAAREHVTEQCASELNKALHKEACIIEYPDFADYGTENGLRLLVLNYYDRKTCVTFFDENGDTEIPQIINTSSLTFGSQEPMYVSPRLKARDFMMEKISVHKPHAIIISAKNRDAVKLRDFFQHIIDEKVGDGDMPKIKILLMPTKFASLEKDNPTCDSLVQEAKSMFHLLRDPLHEISKLFNENDDILYVSLNPHQFEVNGELRGRLERVMVAKLIKMGLNIADGHTENLLKESQLNFEKILQHMEHGQRICTNNILYHTELDKDEYCFLFTGRSLEVHKKCIYKAFVNNIAKTTKYIKEIKNGNTVVEYNCKFCDFKNKGRDHIENHIGYCDNNEAGLRVYIPELKCTGFIMRSDCISGIRMKTMVRTTVMVKVKAFDEKRGNLILDQRNIASDIQHHPNNMEPSSRPIVAKNTISLQTRTSDHPHFRNMTSEQVKKFMLGKDNKHNLEYVVHPCGNDPNHLYVSWIVIPGLVGRMLIRDLDKVRSTDIGKLVVENITYSDINELEVHCIKPMIQWAEQLKASPYWVEHYCRVKSFKYTANERAPFIIKFDRERVGKVMIAHYFTDGPIENYVKITNRGYEFNNRYFTTSNTLFGAIEQLNNSKKGNGPMHTEMETEHSMVHEEAQSCHETKQHTQGSSKNSMRHTFKRIQGFLNGKSKESKRVNTDEKR